jgi:Uma2 family endonuclease
VTSQAPVSDEFPASSVPKKERDWSLWYLDEDEEREELTHSNQQSELIEYLVSALRFWLQTQGRSAYVRDEQRFAWMQEEPRVAVSPDAYVLEPPPQVEPGGGWTTWNTWEHEGQVPVLAVEIVSNSNASKDYDDAPLQYAALGVPEWLRIDMEWERRPKRWKASALTVFQATEQGTQVQRSNQALFLQTMGVWVVYQAGSLLLAEDRAGKRPLLSDHERAEAETKRAETEAKRAETEAKRADHEAKRAESEAKLKEEAEKRADQESLLKQQAEERAALAEAKLAALLAKMDPKSPG